MRYNENLKVQRYSDIQLVLINIDEVTKKRLVQYISFEIDLKNGEGMPEIYAFIFNNITQPENYIVQHQEDSYFIQRLGK